MSSSPLFLDPVVIPLVRGECILDVACGYGRWGCLMHTNYFDFGQSTPPAVDGLDAFAPNVEHAKKLGVYRKVWQAELPCELPRGVYHTILASEVLEHLPLEDAKKSLEEFEAAASDRVVITTPNWECLRDGTDTYLGRNEYDHHLSYIPSSYFRERGYQLYGAGFGNPRTWSIKFFAHTARLFGIRDFSVFESLSKKMPSLAHTLVAAKDMKGNRADFHPGVA